MIFTAVIIDDDQINNKVLSDLLKNYCPDIKILACATNVEEGIRTMVKHKPQILFLDIQIHNKTGFDIIKVLDDPSLQIILITAYEKYALQAFKFAVVDYLLKPIAIEELIAACKRCKSRIVQIMEAEKKSLPGLNSSEFLAVRHRAEVEMVQFIDIIHLESTGGYTTITITKNRKAFSSRSLKETETLLPKGMFIRVHNSHIVNTRQIVRYLSAKAGALEMSDGTQIPISPIKKKIVMELFNI